MFWGGFILGAATACVGMGILLLVLFARGQATDEPVRHGKERRR